MKTITLQQEATEEEALTQECTDNILKNIQNAIDRQQEPPNKISQLLAMKWFIENGLNTEIN